VVEQNEPFLLSARKLNLHQFGNDVAMLTMKSVSILGGSISSLWLFFWVTGDMSLDM
jgi:hypothetical protein